MSKLVDNWCVDWDRVKTVFETSYNQCEHLECPYKHCVYHEEYDSRIDGAIYTPTTIREMSTCMMYLDI